MSGIVAFRLKTNHAIRCDKCHKATHEVYRVTLGTILYNLCSGMCAEKARIEFENKKNIPVTITSNPKNEEDIEDGL